MLISRNFSEKITTRKEKHMKLARFLFSRRFEVIVTPFIKVTNRFHVAVRLFSNRSQMTSKYGKNKKMAHEEQPSVSLMFLPHFDVLCDVLLNRRTATWNLFVTLIMGVTMTSKWNLFVLYNKK